MKRILFPNWKPSPKKYYRVRRGGSAPDASTGSQQPEFTFQKNHLPKDFLPDDPMADFIPGKRKIAQDIPVDEPVRLPKKHTEPEYSPDEIDFSAFTVDDDLPEHRHAAPVRRPVRRVKKQKLKLPAIIICLCVLLILLLVLCYSLIQNANKKGQAPNSGKGTVSSANSADASQDALLDAKKNIDLNAWNLILVNSTHTIGEDFAPVTKTLSNGKEVDERIFDSLNQMITAAEAENLYIIPCSTYRTYDYQVGLFEKQIKSVQNTTGVTREEAEKEAGTVVAVPGTSEHQTGLAVDIITRDYQSLDEGILDTPEVAWLYENCYKYGFIVRYPANTKNVTGIIYEPWHYRYVGVEAATEIMERGITLEQYIEEAQQAQGITDPANSTAGNTTN